jgi:hypothetical protein
MQKLHVLCRSSKASGAVPGAQHSLRCLHVNSPWPSLLGSPLQLLFFCSDCKNCMLCVVAAKQVELCLWHSTLRCLHVNSPWPSLLGSPLQLLFFIFFSRMRKLHALCCSSKASGTVPVAQHSLRCLHVNSPWPSLLGSPLQLLLFVFFYFIFCKMQKLHVLCCSSKASGAAHVPVAQHSLRSLRVNSPCIWLPGSLVAGLSLFFFISCSFIFSFGFFSKT